MKPRFLALTPVALLAAGVGVVLLAGFGGWLLTRAPADRSPAIHIALAPPLLTAPAPNAANNSPLSLPNPVVPTAAPVVGAEPAEPAPVPAAPAVPATALTRLIVPRLNLDVPVVVSPLAGDSWQVDHLQQTVGHLAGTASPGSAGNTVIAGHVSLADGAAGPFARLAQLSPRDEVWLVQGQATFKYVVATRQMVDPTAIEVTYPSSTGQITLITCSDWQPVGRRYASRLVVTGYLVTG